jgi:penicillin-binding protein-related factor A (putative recombinase)
MEIGKDSKYMGFWIGPNNGKNFFLMQILKAEQDKISGTIDDRFGQSIIEGKFTETLVEFSKYPLNNEGRAIGQAIFYKGKKENMSGIYKGKYFDVKIDDPHLRKNMFVIEQFDPTPTVISSLKKHIPKLQI